MEIERVSFEKYLDNPENISFNKVPFDPFCYQGVTVKVGIRRDLESSILMLESINYIAIKNTMKSVAGIMCYLHLSDWVLVKKPEGVCCSMKIAGEVLLPDKTSRHINFTRKEPDPSIFFNC
jgi:hypothetical protein